METIVAIIVLGLLGLFLTAIAATFCWGIVLIMIRQVAVAWKVPAERYVVTDDMLLP